MGKAGREKLQQTQTQYAVQPLRSNNNRKRPISTMQTNECTDSSSSRKRQRINSNNSNNKASMFVFGGNKKVLSLQQICIDVMKKNAMKIGKLPMEMSGNLVQQIYGSLKPLDLKKVYKANPHLRVHLDLLWRRQLKSLNPKYVKMDDSMSWFKAYQLYLIEKRDKLENAKQKLAQRHEAAKHHKESRTKLLSNEEAVRFKAYNHNNRRNKRYKMNQNAMKKSRMMKDCMDFVNRRNKMFAGGLRANNKNIQASYNRKQSFVRRQKEIRDQRKADKNRMCQ